MRNVLIGLGLLVALLVLVWVMNAPASGRATGPALVAVGEVQITRTTSGHQIAGRVKNQATRPYSGQVTVTLFNETGRIIGTYLGAVNDVAPGDEVTYLAIGTEHPETWAKVEAKVTLQIPR